MRTNRAAWGYALGLLFCLSATPSAASFEDEYEKYQLFVDCEPISIGVIFESPHAMRAGMTATKIRRFLQGRLQTVGVPLDLSAESLSAAVYLAIEDRPVIKGRRDVTRVSIAFWKTMREPFGQHIGYSSTWEYVTLMDTDLDEVAFYVAMTMGLDKFIEQYGRVNATRCSPN